MPLRTLVARGEVVAERVYAQFDTFFQQRINEVREIADKLEKSSGDLKLRKAFFYAVQDLRSSSATAKRSSLNAILMSFAGVTRSFDPQTRQYFEIVRLHFDALALVTTAGVAKNEADRLIKDLASAVDVLKMRQIK